MSLGAWFRAARPLAHANIAPPILLGQGLAFARTGSFDPALAAVAYGFGVVDHLTIVFANDYADREADALADSRTLLSGGSGVLVEGLLSPRAVRNAATFGAALLLAGSALAGTLLGRPLLPLFAVAALLLLQAYSFGPLRLSYRGFGELLQGVGVGLVLPLLGYYTQTGDLARAPWDCFGPLVLLAFASNVLTALPDHAGDARAAKRTWPVRRGEPRARRDALAMVGVALVLVTQVGPRLSAQWTALIVGPPALAALLSLGWLRPGRPVLPFVTLTAGGVTLVHLTWSLALFVAESSARGS